MPQPVTKTAQCLAVLQHGPATTTEICATFGWPSREAGATLAAIYQRGLIFKKPFARLDIDTDDHHAVTLWTLPEHADQWKATGHPTPRGSRASTRARLAQP